MSILRASRRWLLLSAPADWIARIGMALRAAQVEAILPSLDGAEATSQRD